MNPLAHRTLLALSLAGVVAACGDDEGTGPDATPASIEGTVEETTPAPTASSAPAAAPGTDAESVAAVTVEADGTLTTVAEAATEADASYVLDSVPAGLTDLAVVAYVGERDAGRVLIHEATTAGTVVEAAPINYETTVEARAWSDVLASGGGEATSSAEVALLLHMEGAEIEALLASDTEIEALAEGLVVAGETLTGVFSTLDAALDAAARAEIEQEAAATFATSRNGGTSLAAAHDALSETVLDGFEEAGASAEEIVVATAAAASTLDATVEERVTTRGAAVSEAVHLNLRARSRLAAESSGSAFADVAGALETVLANTRAAVRGAVDAGTVRDALTASHVAAASAVVTASVEVLAAGQSVGVQAEVAAAAEEALEAARLDALLEGAADAVSAAALVADYRTGVEDGVAQMIVASGASDVDAGLLVSLFIAAGGGPHIR